MVALERVNRFWAWHVSHHDPEVKPAPVPVEPGDWMLGKICFTSWGFLLKVDGGVLTKSAPIGE